MLCSICNKNQATVHLTEIVDEQMTELHLCEDCARQKSLNMEQQFGLADLLAGMVNFGKQPEDKNSDLIKCPNCNLSYADFKKIGRLGCSECYSAFRKLLIPLLKKIHGSTTYIGKTTEESVSVKEPLAPMKFDILEKPEVKTSKQPDLAELKNKLTDAIKAENFEEAARIRDEIKMMEKKEIDTIKKKNSKIPDKKDKS